MPTAGQAKTSFRLETPGGETVLADDDLVGYHWSSHTLTLRPGVRQRIRDAYAGRLVPGTPFVVVAGGAACYRGVLTSSVSSAAHACPVVNLDPTDGSPPDRLAITLGYPTRDFFTGPDPRGDERVRRALGALGKLS